MRPNLLLLPFFLLFIECIQAQPFTDERDREVLNNIYNKSTSESSAIYTGRVYQEQIYAKRGSPFFPSDTLAKGWLVYDGHLFPEVSLQWDILQNFVLIRSQYKILRKLVLNNNLIDSFSFAGHVIKNLPADKDKNLLNGGLYDIIYAGKSDVMVKRKRTTMVEFENQRVIYRFVDKNVYYIRKDDLYYRVNNKADVFRLFGDRYKSGIKKEVRRQDLIWRRNFEQCLTIAATYYDKVKH